MRKPFWRGVLVALVALLALSGCGDDKPTAKKVDETLQRGLAAHVAGDTEKALDLYDDVLEADPGNKFALYNIGLIKQNAGDKAEAERRYRATIAVDPNYGPALFNLAIIRFEAGANDEAIDLYRRVIAINPKDANAHLNLGFALKAVGKQAEGDRELTTAVKLDPALRSRIPAKAAPTPNPSPASPSASPSS